MNHTHTAFALGGARARVRAAAAGRDGALAMHALAPGTVASPNLRCVGLVVGAVGG